MGVSTITILLFSVCAAAAILIAAWKQEDHRRRWLPTASFICVVVIAAVGAYESHQSSRKDQELSARAEELAELTSRIHGEQTEGDSYGFVRFFYGELGTFQMHFKNAGPHTLHSIQLRIVDLTELDRIEQSLAGTPVPWPEERFASSEVTFNIGDLGPGQVRKIGLVRLPAESGRHGVNIWITTRFKTFIEEARFRRTLDRWMPAFRLDETTGEDPVTRHLSIEGFPTDLCGRPVWDWPGGPDGGQEALKAKWGPCASDPDQMRAGAAVDRRFGGPETGMED